MTHDSAPSATDSPGTSVTVSDPAVVVSSTPALTAVEGASTGSVLVATFTDPGGPETVGHYTASINWGDGMTASTGTVTYNASTHVFSITGTHIYSLYGSYSIFVTVSHDVAPNATDPTATPISVSDPSVIGTGGFTFNATAGVASPSQTVATFTDPGGFARAKPAITGPRSAGATARRPAAAMITFNSATLVFTVSATHTYSAVGSYRIVVTLSHDKLGHSVRATSSATVVAALKTIGLLLLDPTGNGALTDSGNGHISRQ